MISDLFFDLRFVTVEPLDDTVLIVNFSDLWI